MRHLLDFQGWQRSQIEQILETSKVMSEVLERPIKKVPALQGFTVCTAFFENSTRTRGSFELAARRMNADVFTFAAGSSSLSKGESLKDTIETLNAMKVDCFIVRHHASGAAHQVAQFSGKSTINAGDGRRAHPTQALLDAYTMFNEFGRLDGLKVAIVGDILHSRVARSNAELLSLMGAKVVLCGPSTLLPKGLASEKVAVTSNLKDAVQDADVVMALRIQKERMTGGYLPSMNEYALTYQVNEQVMQWAKPSAIVMHPGPMNRDLEMSGSLADSSRSRIVQQVENGVATRMSVLYHLLVGKK